MRGTRDDISEGTDAVRSRAGGLFKLRARSDNLPQQWWFASTAIPLVAATIGPLSSVISIAALVSPWRLTLPVDNGQHPLGVEDYGVGIADPHWELVLNALSLACGFAGNITLLLHFTGRMRYIVALPVSGILWITSSISLIGIIGAMSMYAAPVGPGEVYSQGFWHAVIASITYFIGGMLLVINMIGYFRGHYPQQFDLDETQRSLILMTMMFSFWLAGGAGGFCALEGWTFPDALYFADVSILTVGLGDFAPKTDAGRGFLFVFELVGIIFLGLVVHSIARFAAHISTDKVIKLHQQHAREWAVGRTVTNERELRERLGLPPPRTAGTKSDRRVSLTDYGRIQVVGRTVTFHEKRRHPRTKLLLLQEEKDRFDAMRQIQQDTKRWKQYWALVMAFLAFGILCGVGAAVFMVTESQLQGMTYFNALYFCFVALMSIGYGDVVPKSNIGKPFFIIWSLIAVPVVTVLVQAMSRTVVVAISRGTFKVADWTIMPKEGVFRDFLDRHPVLRNALASKTPCRQPDEHSSGLGSNDCEKGQATAVSEHLQLERLVLAGNQNHGHLDLDLDLARELTEAIKAVAQDLRADPPRRYTYEQWVRFTRLIRFSADVALGPELPDHGLGLVEWDWIGEDSPMLAEITEAEWVLHRLCESLNRYMRGQGQLSQAMVPCCSLAPVAKAAGSS